MRRTMQQLHRRASGRPGQSLVEFALMLPLLILLLLGTIDITLVYYRYIAVANAARAGAAFYGANYNNTTTPPTGTDICTAVTDELGQTKPISLAGDITTCASQVHYSNTSTTVSVTVTMPFTPVVPGVYEWFPNLKVQYTASYPIT